MTVKDHDLASKAGLLVSYYITLSFWSAQTLALSMVSRNIAGQTKKSTVVAMTFVSWAVGNAIGPQVFLERDAPRYFIAFAVHLACYALLVVDIVLLRFYLKAQNKKKDRIQEAQGGVNQAEARAHALQIDDFERLSELAFKEFPVPSRELVEDLLDTRASTNVFWDPLIPEYLDLLYRKRRVTLQDILRCLLRKSTVFRLRTEPSGDRDAKRTLKRKRRGSNYDTLVSDFRIIQNGLMALTSGFPPLTKSDAIETLLAIVEWMKIICAPYHDGQKEGQARQCTWIMSSPDGVSLVEALGILTAGLLATQTTIDAVISPKSDGLRRKMGKALGPYILLCDQFSVPLRMRLESLQKEFNLFDRHKKSVQEGDMSAMNLSVLDFEANIIDSPPVNAKAGLYIYLNAMGNNIAIVEELITAAFDMLANAKSRNELLFLKKSFLINKVPSLLQELATETPHPVPMELCISHALSRVDSQAFPSLSASFVNKFHKSSPLSDVRQEFVFSCALHKLIPEASIEPLLGEIPMQSLPSGGQRTRADVTSQIIQYPERLEQFLKKIESMDGNPSVMTVALTDVCLRDLP
ncbi:mediator complex subunit [Ascosphaera pollenicola]|nr:mediator complex subunit [Ascosphaera pollenicola]